MTMLKKILFAAFLCMMALPAFAAAPQEKAPDAPMSYFAKLGAELRECEGVAAGHFDRTIDCYMKPVAQVSADIIFVAVPIGGMQVPLIILWLMAIGIFTSVYYGFINFRCFWLSLQLLGGKYQSKDRAGQISNWEALSTSLSGTVGLGNIAGVAVAVSIGGPSATVWMILMGFLGMTTKFLECSLGVKYRTIDAEGVASGGPMYYIRRGFSDRGLPKLGKALAVFFALCCIGGAIGGGNMFQANQTFQMYLRVAGEGSYFADKAWLFGIGLAVLTGAAIIGGIKSIARVSETIFPMMAGIYLLIGLYIIGANIEHLPHALSSIFGGLFTPEAATGGLLGALIAGVKRAVFSNEAGCGSAPITYGAVKADSHIAQGLIAMLNPFIDTVIICTLTAVVIAVTGVYEGGKGMEGVALTARAFATAGDWTKYWLGLTVFLFAYSTLISWYYLGEKAFAYLAGRSHATIYGFKVFYCLCVVVGCAAKLSNIIDFTDALFFAMAIPNVVVLYMMAPEIKRDLKAYLAEIRAKKAAGA